MQYQQAVCLQLYTSTYCKLFMGMSSVFLLYCQNC